MAAPAYIAKGTAGTGTGSSVNFNYMASINANDGLYLFVASVGLGTITVDASWSLLGTISFPTPTPDTVCKLYHKLASGSEDSGSEAVSRSGHSGSSLLMAQVYQYRGNAYLTVEDCDFTSGTSSTITWNATTVAGTERTLAAFVFNGGNPGVPSGYTGSASDNSGSSYMELNSKENVSSDGSVTDGGGATGWATFHLSMYNNTPPVISARSFIVN